MRIRTTILALATLAIVSACEQSTSWPPNQAKLKYVFGQQKATFLAIEREMAADGLTRMGPQIYLDKERNPVVPRLPSDQGNKYEALFDRTQMYLYVTRREQSTSFELLLQNIGPRLYLSRFIHRSTDDDLPNCAASMRQAACGACSIRLEREWLLEYSWVPANPEEEARQC